MRAYQRVALVLVLLLGVGLIVFPLAYGLPKKTQGVDDVTNAFRADMTQSSIDRSNADLRTVNEMLAQLREETIPQQAAAAGQTPQQYQATLGTLFPAVGKGLAESPEIMNRFNHLVGTMDEQAPNFRKADAIPTADLPNTTVTYLYLVPGVLLVIVAGLGLVASFAGGRAVLVTISLTVAAALGLLMIAGALATSVIDKTKAAEKMFDAFRPAFSEQGYQQSRSDLDTLKALAGDMRNKVIPLQAARSGVTPEQYSAQLAQHYPAVGKGLAQTDAIITRFDAMVEKIGQNVGSFHEADSIPTEDTAVSVMPWLLIGPGIAIAAVAGSAAVLGRREGDGGAATPAAPAADAGPQA